MDKSFDLIAAKKKVLDALEKIRPFLQADGGDAELVDLSPDGKVTISFLGACHGCPMSTVTLKQGIEQVIRHEVPEITAVEAVLKEK